MRTPIITAALALVACGGPDVATEAEPLPWIAVLADGALTANEEVFGVVERPVVEVETAPGLERFAADLALVPGAADRETRAMYVRRTEPILKLFRDRMARAGYEGDLPPPPTNDEPLPWAAWKDEQLRLGEPLVSGIHSGPWTILLLEVETDTKTRKAARFVVGMGVPPYTTSKGRVRNRGHPAAFQHEVEALWDGSRWVAGADVRTTTPIPEWMK